MKKFILAALVLLPALASAQLNNVSGLLTSFGNLVETALPIVVALALLAFFWGLVNLIWGGGEKVEEGKTYMIWSVVALFVMVSVWGLTQFIGTAFNISSGGTVPVPGVQGL